VRPVLQRTDDSGIAVAYRARVSTSALVRSVAATARRSPAWLRRPWVVDLLVVLVIGVFAVVGAIESARGGSGERRLDWLAWALVAVATVALAARRQRPAMVLLVTSAATAVSVGLGYPLGLLWVTPLLALYTAAATGRRTLAVAAAVALAAALVGWALLAGDLGTPAEVGISVLIIALALATGEVARGRRDYLAEVERRAVEAERTREETVRRHAGEERLRLARDLHDITAHTIAVIAIQAGVADEALGGCQACPPRAREAVRAIRASSRQALAELKATVTTLREGAAPRGPLPGLGQLEVLVAMARSAGVGVQLAVSGALRPLPPAIDLTAYRIVQEALTNVLRHAGPATSAAVRLRYARDALEVEVDDGRGAGTTWPPRGGNGLLGMREQIAALGGRLGAGPSRPAASGCSPRCRWTARREPSLRTVDGAGGGVGSGADREQLPLAGYPPERAGPPVLQHVVGAGDQVVHGPGHQHLPGARSRHHPRGQVHGDAADIGAADLHLAGVQARADLHADPAQPVAQGGGAADAAARPVEDGQHAVPGRLDQPTAEAVDQLAGEPVVGVQQLAPAAVADLPGPLGRADDVGEQDCRQRPAGLGRPPGAGAGRRGGFRALPGGPAGRPGGEDGHSVQAERDPEQQHDPGGPELLLHPGDGGGEQPGDREEPVHHQVDARVQHQPPRPQPPAPACPTAAAPAPATGTGLDGRRVLSPDGVAVVGGLYAMGCVPSAQAGSEGCSDEPLQARSWSRHS
jgi:signal transduction histidine kinase